MKKQHLLLWLLSLLFAAGLTAMAVYLLLRPDFKLQRMPQAAFVLSFDDAYLEDWHQARPLLSKHGVKATFFITTPHELTPEDSAMLAALAAEGHEISSHAFSHQNARQFVEKKGLEAYLEAEILPSIQALNRLGHHPVTFAYPYGARTRPIDFELKKYFYLLRGDSWKVLGKGINELDRIFYTYNGDKVVNGLGIDNGSNIAVQELEAGFARARERQEAIILYAHAINQTGDKYSITPARLDSVLTAAKAHGLVSLRFRDLVL